MKLQLRSANLEAALKKCAAVGFVTLATGALFAGGGLLLQLLGLLPLREMLDLFLVGALCGGVISCIVALTE